MLQARSLQSLKNSCNAAKLRFTWNVLGADTTKLCRIELIRWTNISGHSKSRSLYRFSSKRRIRAWPTRWSIASKKLKSELCNSTWPDKTSCTLSGSCSGPPTITPVLKQNSSRQFNLDSSKCMRSTKYYLVLLKFPSFQLKPTSKSRKIASQQTGMRWVGWFLYWHADCQAT